MAAKTTRSSRTKSGRELGAIIMLIFARVEMQVAGTRSASSAR